MRHFLVVALLSVGALIAFATIHSPLAGFSGSAQAAKTYNSSHSNMGNVPKGGVTPSKTNKVKSHSNTNNN